MMEKRDNIEKDRKGPKYEKPAAGGGAAGFPKRTE
jgi:hypothetical protein